jgi:hypothetical protein
VRLVGGRGERRAAGLQRALVGAVDLVGDERDLDVRGRPVCGARRTPPGKLPSPSA